MKLRIADLTMEVACRADELERLPNFVPFVVPDERREEIVCRIDTGCPLRAEDGVPQSVSRVGGKLLALWLYPDCCSVSLVFAEGGFCYRLRADRCWRRVQTNWVSGYADSAFALNDFIMLAFTYRSAFYRTVLVHASSVVIAEDGCAFIGRSGIGKSTHSRLWTRYIPGAWLLNDDQPVLRCMPDGSVRIYGSPWSGKTFCYENQSARLRALFFMEQASANRLLPVSRVEAFRKLMAATSLIGRDALTFSAISETQACIAGAVPGFILENRPEKAAALLSYAAFDEERRK